ADGNHLVDGAIADDFPHDGFRNIAQGPARFANVEKELCGIRDAILNHPLHQCSVQVTRHHLRFPLGVARNLIRIVSPWRPEPEFLLQLPFHRNNCGQIDAEWQFEMQSGWNFLEILAEALNHSDRVARHCEICGPRAYAEQSEDDNHDRSTRPTPRHDLVELILPLPYQILEIGAGSSPTTPGAAPAAAIVLRRHLNVLRLRSRSASSDRADLPNAHDAIHRSRRAYFTSLN